MRGPVEVRLWGRRIGAVARPDDSPVAAFQYDPEFARSGIEVSPLTMPLGDSVYRFPGLGPSFFGLPGLLADALPDRFGHALIDAWLARQGRAPADFDALDRLCYVGTRAMGALSFEPATGPEPRDAPLEVAALRELAEQALARHGSLATRLEAGDPADALADILRVGTSAGGARAKALVAWNEATGEVRSGHLDLPAGFTHWLLKFDGVAGNGDHGLQDPAGFGALEFAYHRMALAAGIEMAPCRLLQDGRRRHFMTRRFDRGAEGRLHLQSLAALAHLDYDQAGVHGYEQAFDVARRLGLGGDDRDQLFRRMVFNLVARNQDDHVKNIGFLMQKSGAWRLAPAYDLTWAFNPDGPWTRRHQMTVGGKTDGFAAADLEAIARVAPLPRGRWRRLLDDVLAAVRSWPEIADEVGIDRARSGAVAATHRLRW